MDEHSDGAPTAASGPATAEERGMVLAEVSNRMVRLYKEHFGRGPTKARSHFAGRDILICTLRESFTPAEKRLVEMGETQRMRETRLYFQHATEDEFRAVVEETTGRKVTAFISGIDAREDVSVEVFLLEPQA